MTAWLNIKAEYLKGVAPKDLAKKYKIKAKTIHEKASKENWVAEKTSIYKNLQERTEERINNLTQKAFNALEQVLDDENAEYKDKVAAAKAIIDVSGLKKDKHEVKNLTPLVVVEDEKHKNILEQIKNKNADLN